MVTPHRRPSAALRRLAPTLALLLALLLGAPAPAAAAGHWAQTDPMIQDRAGHTATLLLDGRVLVAGGYRAVSRYEPGVAGDLAAAELYDPAARAWRVTGSLREARYAHTATLLPDGRALVVGGLGQGGYRASAELYSATTGSWSAAPPLAYARAGHTATLLPGGRVLVVGGYAGAGEVGPSELFDPATGRWSLAAALAAPRTDHTATLLPDGRVLVVGGSGGGCGDPGGACGGALASAELYDPAAGRWGGAALAPQAVCGHTATLLPGGDVLILWADGAWRYSPANDSWRAAAPPPVERLGHSAAALADGRVLVVGGQARGAWYEASWASAAALYDGGADAWLAAGSYTIRGASVTLLQDGTLLVAGGIFPTSLVPIADWTTPAAWIFDPALTRLYLPQAVRPGA